MIKAIGVSVKADLPLADCITTGVCPPDVGEDKTQICDDRAIDWSVAQREDPSINRLVHLVHSGSRPRGDNLWEETAEVQQYLREWNRLKLEDDILLRTTTLDGQQVKQLVLPTAFKAQVLKGLHDDVGHPGKDKSLWLARQRFYWPGLERDVEQYIHTCSRCLLRKSPQQCAERVSIQTTKPMELIVGLFVS